MFKHFNRVILAILFVQCISVISYAQKQKLEAVDLGLSVKWANMNVGASSPTEYGGYYAWGEVQEKRFYYFIISSQHIKVKIEGNGDIKNSTAANEILKYSNADNKIILDLEDDVANKTFGKTWRIPTVAQMQELIDKCDWTATTVNGSKGFLVKSRVNSNSIFLPLAGYKTGHETKGSIREYCSTQAYYWTSSLVENADALNSHALFIHKTELKGDVGGFSLMPFHRTNGCVVRPVCY